MSKKIICTKFNRTLRLSSPYRQGLFVLALSIAVTAMILPVQAFAQPSNQVETSFFDDTGVRVYDRVWDGQRWHNVMSYNYPNGVGSELKARTWPNNSASGYGCDFVIYFPGNPPSTVISVSHLQCKFTVTGTDGFNMGHGANQRYKCECENCMGIPDFFCTYTWSPLDNGSGAFETWSSGPAAYRMVVTYDRQ